MLIIRSLKSELMLGLTQNTFHKLFGKDPNWLINGQYGIIQLMKSSCVRITGYCRQGLTRLKRHLFCILKALRNLLLFVEKIKLVILKDFCDLGYYVKMFFMFVVGCSEKSFCLTERGEKWTV